MAVTCSPTSVITLRWNDENDSRLFAALIARTKEGKLHWAETASENTFIVAVNGVMMFRFSLLPLSWRNHLRPMRTIQLEAIGEHGDTTFKVVSQSSRAIQAWRLARHNSQRPHEGIDEALLLLESI